MPISGDYLGMTLVVPDNDPHNRQYFRYCAQGELRLQQCGGCGKLRYPPSTLCPYCAGAEFSWQRLDGGGEVYTFTEVHHATSAAFKAAVPYVVAIVALDLPPGHAGDEVRLVANLVDADGHLTGAANLRIGSRVRVSFHPVAEDLALPMVRLT